jgi:hypothetical protein
VCGCQGLLPTYPLKATPTPDISSDVSFLHNGGEKPQHFLDKLKAIRITVLPRIPNELAKHPEALLGPPRFPERGDVQGAAHQLVLLVDDQLQ